jgi:hypothetical protein
MIKVLSLNNIENTKDIVKTLLDENQVKQRKSIEKK